MTAFQKACFIAGGVLLTIGTIGCRHQVNSTNPAVIQAVSLLDARKTVNSIAHGLKAANDTVKSLATTEPDYYTYVHPKLSQLAVLNDRANAAITAAENGSTTVDWKSAIVAVAQAVGDPRSLTTFGFKNPGIVGKVEVGFAGLIEGISLAQQFGSQ